MRTIVLITVALVVCSAFAAKTCTKANDCASEANGAQNCVLDRSSNANSTTLGCLECDPTDANKDCFCGLSEICYNVPGDSKWGTCQPANLTMIGKQCDPAVTAANLDKDTNTLAFCGATEIKENKLYVQWSGACVSNVCQRCTVGGTACTITDGDRRTCPNGDGYVDNVGGVTGWAALGSNVPSFFSFLYALVLIPVAAVLCFKTVKTA